MSVEKYFPADGPEGNAKNQRFANLARQKLGDLYLEQDKLQQAMDCYTDLENLGPEDPLLQAFGLVGQINVHVQQGELEEINEKIITGTNGGSIVPGRDIPRFVDLMMAGELPFDAVTDRYYNISQVAEAFDDLEQHRMTRGAFRFESSPS